MEYLVALYLFVIGASFGSFAGAMAWRIEKEKDVFRDRSECEHCHHKLSWKDLIPVMSWLWLRGRCRYCRRRIGVTPIVVELVMGVALVLSYLYWPYELSSALDIVAVVLWLFSLVLLAILFLYDMRHSLLPGIPLLLLIGAGAVLFVLRAISLDWSIQTGLLELILGLLPVAGIYGFLWYISRQKWVGFGDVELGIFIGLALGWQGALLTLFLANILGCLWIIPGLLTKRLARTSRVPFGPFLILGAFIAFLWGESLVGAYMRLFIV